MQDGSEYWLSESWMALCQNIDETENEDTDAKENQDDEETTALPNVKKYQAVDDVTCIVSNYPDVNVVVNTSSKPKEVKIRDSIKNGKFILAPGEGIVPSNIMREKC